jgi:hypothetical protein
VGIPDQYIGLAMIYCAVIPTMGAATPSGTLRALDRFDLLGWQGCSYPIARAALAAVAFAAGAPFEAYLAIWFVTTSAATSTCGFCRGASLSAATCCAG